MSLLSTVMNHAADLTCSESFFSRNITSRLLTVGICPPLEAMECLIGTIKLPFQACGAAVKIPATAINLALSSRTLREFTAQLSGPVDLVRSALKIAGFALGFFFTLSFGFLSPMTNFKLHHALGLVRDEKAESLHLAKLEEAQRKKEAYERMLEEQLSRITDALRLKIMETVPPPQEMAVESPSEQPEAQEIEAREESQQELLQEPIEPADDTTEPLALQNEEEPAETAVPLAL